MLKAQEEIRILSSILSFNEKHAPKKRRYEVIAGTFGVASALLLILAFTSMSKTELTLVLVSYFLGSGAVFVSWQLTSIQHWPIVAPHINKESVAARLKQLGT